MKKDVVFPEKKMPILKNYSPKSIKTVIAANKKENPEILMISTFPQRQCGVSLHIRRIWLGH